MHRTTIMLPQDLKVRALHRARDIGVSLGEFIRSAMENMLTQPHSSQKQDRFWTDTYVCSRPCPEDLSKNHDEYLYGEKK